MRIKPYLLLLAAIISITSCQPEVPDTLPGENPPDGTDTTTPGNVIRAINVKGVSFSDPVNFTYTIQYDTPASKITVLLNDSIPGIFDPAYKGVAYQFNKAGYLMRSDMLKSNGTQEPQYSIFRNATNQVEKIIEYDTEEVNGMPYNDTSYYRFAPGLIEDSVRYAHSSGISRTVRTFDAQNRLQSVAYYFANTRNYMAHFSYDAQGNVTRIAGDSDTTDYTYGTQAGAAWKALPELFLGKDAHVLMRERHDEFGFNFLSFIIESDWETIYNPLFTQPLTRMARHGQSPFNSDTPFIQAEVAFTTTYTPEGNVKTITATPSNEGTLTYTFSY